MASALVTGGSSGIGLAIARMLAAEGHALTLCARTPAKLETAAAELGAHAVAADLREAEACERAVAAHVAAHGGLDVLVNSAGVGVAGALDEQEVRSIDLQLDVNLRALLLVTRAALPHLRASRGLVVNLASIAGTIPVPSLPVYGAAKAAVISLTGSLNAALAADGVRVHALCPGYVDTPMAAHTGLPPGEMIQPDDCAEVVRMLLRLSPQARVPQVVIERLGA
jgi:short-subunit dehydrogenase